MTRMPDERVYHLLPEIYRRRDHDQGEPLRALLAVVGHELQSIESGIDGLYDNWFIETCDEWVVPYIGDLLGVRGLSDEKSVLFSQRSRVANTIHYRRRKGTLTAIEDLILDFSGWTAHAVEMRKLVAASQHLGHVRKNKGGTFDVRDVKELKPLAGPFETAAHNVDVRRISNGEGRYNINNLMLFLWRLQSYRISNSPASPVVEAADGRYSFHPLGHDIPLFTRPRARSEVTEAAAKSSVPRPIGPSTFNDDLAEYRKNYADLPEDLRPAESTYYGGTKSFSINKDGELVSPLNIVVKDLNYWSRPPAGEGKVAVDVQRGRIAFAEGEGPTESVMVNYHYGFSADIGGGTYNRQETLSDIHLLEWNIAVRKDSKIDTLQMALKAWEDTGSPHATIRIGDSCIYGGYIDIELPENGSLTIEADDGVRPVLRLIGDITAVGPKQGIAELKLNGLLIESGIELEGGVGLRVNHCTLLPGQLTERDGRHEFPAHPSIEAKTESSNLKVNIHHSITGAIRLPALCKGLTIEDTVLISVMDEGSSYPAIAAPEELKKSIEAKASANEKKKIQQRNIKEKKLLPYGPPTRLERCTIFGPVMVDALSLASEVIFTEPVKVQRRQSGCMRFCYVPQGSRTSSRFRCQPDLALVESKESDDEVILLARVQPRFTATDYGDPAFAQLADDCAVEIRTGAEDGSEMGVFSHLKNTQRKINLDTILDEYLPAGLEMGVNYVT